MISHVHHINFIVRDLRTSVRQYRKLLGLDEFVFDSLEKRAVETARIKLGDTWLVLVQPTDLDSSPAKYLETFGEGFFLLSFATDDLDAQLGRLDQNLDSATKQGAWSKRLGLDNWTVADLPSRLFFGAQLQLTEEHTGANSAEQDH